jgi:integrase
MSSLLTLGLHLTLKFPGLVGPLCLPSAMATLERREQTPGHVTYRVRWWADDRQRSKSFKSYDDARRFKAVLEGDMANGSFIDPRQGAVTLSRFLEEHLDALLIDVRPSTRNRIEGIYRTHVEPQFGHLPLNAVTTATVGKWVNAMRYTLSPSSVRKNVFALRRVLDLAVSYGLVRSNPVVAVKLPQEPKHEQRFLTHDEAWILAESVAARYRALVLLAVFGGMRFGELTALRRMHIVPERNQVAIRETLVEINGKVSIGPPKTKSSVRVVTIPRSVMAEIVSHMNSYTGEGADALVFTGKRGNCIQRHWFSRYYWTPATNAAGLTGLRFHDLRHTFVALWVSLGRNPKEVSKAAGHSSVAFTLDRYGHLYDTDSDSLADELDIMLGLTRTHEAPAGLLLTPAQPLLLTGSTRPPSSSGPGPRPFTAVARVRIPLGVQGPLLVRTRSIRICRWKAVRVPSA